MTNKELAVQLYSACLQASATIFSNPKYSGKISVPTNEQMVKNVKEIAELLSSIEDK